MTAWPPLNAGEDVTIRIPNVRDADTGLALNLAAATVIEWQVRRRPADPGASDIDPDNPVVLAKDLDDDVSIDDADILVEVSALETGALRGTYHADCWVTIALRRRLVKSGPLPVLSHVNTVQAP